MIGISIQLARMEPAPPSVERATLLLDTVKRGSLVRQVRGTGTLVPEDTRWIPATTDGRVERILLRAGDKVEPGSVILELSSPSVEQEALNARLTFQSAEASLVNLRVQNQSALLSQQSQVASLEAEFKQARMQAEADAALAKEKLISQLELQKSEVRLESLRMRLGIEEKRLASLSDALEAQLQVQQATVEQAKAAAALASRRLASLRVTPGFSGVLQVVGVEVGATIGPGTNLARVADPGRLKAQLKVSETQAKDVEVGQYAEVDTRSSVIAGRVSRKDPAAVNGTVTIDVTLTDALPRGAVPDLSVDGTIQLELLDNVLKVSRPALAQEDSTIGLFKLLGSSGDAERVQVQFGRGSVNEIVVKAGLNEGDGVILSDMANYDSYDKVRMR
jgi:HlyD family secretion protein